MLTPAAATAAPRREGQAGFALILAILSLLLLTFLGLTLAATTTTELQIAANQRWSQQARYNAEAGLEVARVILRDIAEAQGSWSQVVHAPQPVGWTTAAPPATTPPGAPNPGPSLDQWGIAARQFENWQCSASTGRSGYGNVLPNAAGTAIFQNVTTLYGRSLNGAVTIWVRRPVLSDGTTGEFHHDSSPRRVVVTAEGVAPYWGDPNAATLLRRRQQAVRVMEISLSLTQPEETCELGEMSQEGMGQSGANFAPCTPVDQFMGNADVDELP